ncbi:MAG: tripartite tricarboxylate transporter TctB family protein [Nocardioidaceae bacterium]
MSEVPERGTSEGPSEPKAPREGSSETEAADPAPAASPLAPIGFGIAALLVGVLLLQQAWKVSGGLSPEGPRFLPVAVGIGWILLAAAYVAGSVIGLVRRRVPDASERFDHLPQVIALLAVMLAYAYGLEPLGYLIATAVFFAVTAAILGSRQHLRDAVVAVGLAVALYFLFSRSLGIYLPAGVLPI